MRRTASANTSATLTTSIFSCVWRSGIVSVTRKREIGEASMRA